MGRIMNQIALPVLITVIIPWSFASAIDPGYARGLLAMGERFIPLTHSTVMLYGNEEGVLEQGELRILLSDREVAESLLSGPFLRPLERMVRKGGLRGILFRLEPRKLTRAVVHGNILLPPEDAGASLPSFAICARGGGFERFETGNNRCWGQIRWFFKEESLSSMEVHAAFSAPFFHDVVTQCFRGRRSYRSPQVIALLAFEHALLEGNLGEAQRYASEERFENLKALRDSVGEQAFLEMVREGTPKPENGRRQIQGVYVREETACIILVEGREKRSQAMVNENGAWKVD